jgi:WhiB family transcriptional regulator, redox-sensing transcriptional regulator
MTVLFSELLIPGWAEGPTAKIGLADVTWAYDGAPVISYTDYSTNSTANSTYAKSSTAKGDYKRADNPFAPEIKSPAQPLSLPCHTADPELFFSESAPVIAQAKALCGLCPMRAKCLTAALSRAEPCGVWGGELFDEGQIIQSKRLPGRPAKVAVAS